MIANTSPSLTVADYRKLEGLVTGLEQQLDEARKQNRKLERVLERAAMDPTVRSAMDRPVRDGANMGLGIAGGLILMFVVTPIALGVFALAAVALFGG